MKCKFLLLCVFVVFGLNGLFAKETGHLRFYNSFSFPLQEDSEKQSDYFAENKASYNFCDHPCVTLKSDMNQSFSLNEFRVLPPDDFKGINVLDLIDRIKQNTNLTSNQTLIVYDHMGKPIKTINTNISIYSIENISILTNGFYDIDLSQLSIKNLKFVIAH